MSREKNMRKNVTAALRGAGLHAMAVENPCKPGTPDVNTSLGANGAEAWIELKYVERWPARPDTDLKLDHFTQQQRIWLEDGWAGGRNAWLLLQVGREFLLFTGPDAALYVGRAPQSTLREAATRHFATVAEMKKRLPRCLTR